MNRPDSQQGLNARERLSRISHHFLSEDERDGATDAPPFFLTALPADAGGANRLPLHDLAAAFVGEGLSVALLDPALSGPCLMYPWGMPAEDAGERRRHGPDRRLQDLPDRCGRRTGPEIVLATRPPTGSDGRGYTVVLIAVPTDPHGMRRAFIRLKELARGATFMPTVVGVTVWGTDNPTLAGRCFDRFAVAAHRFLGITVRSYGCLAAAQASALQDVAMLLLEDWRNWQKPAPRHAASEESGHMPHNPVRGPHEPTTENRTADAR